MMHDKHPRSTLLSVCSYLIVLFAPSSGTGEGTRDKKAKFEEEVTDQIERPRILG